MTKQTIEIGQVIDERFRVSELLGAGTLGPVYKVVDQETNDYGVLKILPQVFARRPALAERFLNAVKKFASFSNSNLAEILGFGSDPSPYVVERFYDGVTLDQLLALKRQTGTPFSFPEFAPLIEAVGTGVNYLHRKGYKLGGVFPKHVFVAGEKLILSDYYLYEAIPPEALVRIFLHDEDRTRYLAPEFVVSPGEVSFAADSYSIGVMLWEAVSGLQFESEFHPVESLEGGDLAAMNKLLVKALNEEPERRYPSLTVLALDLARVEGNDSKVKMLAQVVLSEARQVAASSRVTTEEADPQAVTAAKQEIAPVEKQVESPTDEATRNSKEQTAQAEKTRSLFQDDPAPVEDKTASLGEPADDPAAESAPGKGKLIAAAVFAAALLGGLGFFLSRGGGDRPEPVPVAKTVKKEKAHPFKKTAEVAQQAATAEREKIKANKEVVGVTAWLIAESSFSEAASAISREDYDSAMRLFQAAERGYRETGELLQVSADKTAEVEEKKEKEIAEKQKRDLAAKVKKTAISPNKTRQKKAPKGCPRGMIEIPAGVVLIGSPSADFDRDNWEKVNQKESTGAYCIDKYEYPNKKGSKPESAISWERASSSCRKIGKRLCSETEWERACKGPRGLKYPYGSAYDPNACGTETASGQDRSLSPSGKFAQCNSDYGIMDMSGNVMEWTQTSMDGSKDRVLKGGSSVRPGYSARCATRYPAPEKAREKEFGFRCCTDYSD